MKTTSKKSRRKTSDRNPRYRVCTVRLLCGLLLGVVPFLGFAADGDGVKLYERFTTLEANVRTLQGDTIHLLNHLQPAYECPSHANDKSADENRLKGLQRRRTELQREFRVISGRRTQIGIAGEG